MNVADNLHWRRKLNEGWLAKEDLACCLAYGDDLLVLDAERLADLAGVSNIK